MKPDQACTVATCDRKSHARDYCAKHYKRLMKHGDPLIARKSTIVERFWSKVDKGQPDECWPWTASVAEFGYGRLACSGRPSGYILAHRYSAMLHFGMFDRRLSVCHHCDNPRCVNPAHLYLGSHADNMRDMAAKGRSGGQRQTHCKRGHEFTPENTRISGRRQVRVCRACARAESQSRSVRHA